VAPTLDERNGAFANRLITLLHDLDSTAVAIRSVDNELAAKIAKLASVVRLRIDALGLGAVTEELP
jgi:hypothetical protein